MKKTAFLLGIIGLFALGSCTEETTCTARSADGTKLYEVMGSDVCNDQINTEQGEYCNCDEEN